MAYSRNNPRPVRNLHQQKVQESYKKLEQQKLLEEHQRLEEILKQKQYMKNQSILFEKAISVSSSSAAGAGGGNNRRNQNNDFPELIQQSLLIHWVDVVSDEWRIVIYNYDTGTLSDTINTGLLYNGGSEWYLDREDYTVHNKGFTIVLQNGVTSKFKIFFINPDGTLVATKDLDTQEDFQYTENAIIYLGSLDGVSTCYHYTGSNVRTHTFPDVDINLIEVDDPSGEDVTKDGTILIEAPNNSNFYLARPNGDLIDVSDYLNNGGSANIRLDYNMSFITKYFTDRSKFRIVSEEGVLSEYDLSQHSIVNVYDTNPYGQNCFYMSADDGNYNRLFLSYDGDSDQFVSLTFSTELNGYVRTAQTEFSYYSPKPKAGTHIVVSNSNEVATDSLGYLSENLNLWWLPKGATSFQNYNFGANIGTVSFIEGFGSFAAERTFSKGLNPIVMYSTGAPNDIVVGFMTPTSLATQSTGIKYASCSNIWGSYIGESTFAVFDMDDGSRTWQIYGENSILDETTTTNSWNWGSYDEIVNRKGTLCILDSGDTTKSFVWTEQVGLQTGPTGYGQIYVNNQFARIDFESYPEQIITQYITGEEGSQFVEGFHLLSLSGLSQRVFFQGLSPSNHWTVNNAQVCKDIIYFNLSEDITANTRVIVYKKSDLSLIYDYVFGDNTISSGIIDNRLYIVEGSLTAPSINYILIGHMGIETLEINATTYGQESNDAEDNDV